PHSPLFPYTTLFRSASSTKTSSVRRRNFIGTPPWKHSVVNALGSPCSPPKTENRKLFHPPFSNIAEKRRCISARETCSIIEPRRSEEHTSELQSREN